MENQEQNDLIVVVEQQKTFIINYLKHLNLKIKKNDLSLLLSVVKNEVCLFNPLSMKVGGGF